jgi:hypothetical protein
MDRSPASPLVRQVARAGRRLLAQSFVAALAWAWAAALLLSTGWFLLRPHAFPDLCCPGALWSVPGGLLLAASLIAGVVAWLHRPSPLDAALELDQRFGLKERATTGLTLRPADADSPAGRALLADANHRVEPLRVADRFPVRLTRSAALVPACAVPMLLVAFLYDPQPAAAEEQPRDKQALTKDPVQVAEIEQKKKQLQKPADKARNPDEGKNPELEKLLDDVDKLARKPTGTREEAQDAVKEFGQVEDKLRDREKELAERADALRQQLQDEARLGKKKKPEGPGEKVDQALRQGDLKQAEDELKRLIRRLDPEQQKKAEQQAKDIAQRLKQDDLAKEEREQLERDLADLKDVQPLNDREREQLEQQLKDLKEQADRLGDMKDGIGKEGQQDLKELAEKVGQAEKCLQEGKDGAAARKLGEAAKKMGKLDGGKERQELAQEAAKVAQARRALCQALDQGGPAAGQRPEAKGGQTAEEQKRVRAEVDPKGQLRVRDLVRGDGMKGPRKPAELQEEIRQAAQDAPEALDRQRLPRSATDMARGYFEKLRGPEKDK